jgi:hypothetical protein
MSSRQKGIAFLGGAAIAASTLFAPYRLRSAPNGKGAKASTVVVARWRTTYAPLFLPPEAQTGAYDDVDVVELDRRRLGLWWLAIATVTVVCMVVAPKRE